MQAQPFCGSAKTRQLSRPSSMPSPRVRVSEQVVDSGPEEAGFIDIGGLLYGPRPLAAAEEALPSANAAVVSAAGHGQALEDEARGFNRRTFSLTRQTPREGGGVGSKKHK